MSLVAHGAGTAAGTLPLGGALTATWLKLAVAVAAAW